MDLHIEEALAAISVIEEMYGCPPSPFNKKASNAVCKPNSSELKNYVDVTPSEHMLEAVPQ